MKPVYEYDEKSIMEKSVLEELYSIEDEYDRADRLIALTEKAYDFSKRCGDNFKKMARAYKKQLDKEKKEGRGVARDGKTDFGYFDDGHELNCGNWIANQDGVLQYNPYGIANMACYHPILVTQILKNAETKKQKVKLAFRVAGEWGEIIVDKGLIASASKITALAEYGINATSENAKYLVRYLSDIENMNVGTIERRVSTSKFGWVHGDFIPYGLDVEFDGKEKFCELFESVAEKGDKAKWMDCVKKIRRSGRKEPVLFLAGSFASILLSQLDLLPFVLNLWEKTGKGKTVSTMVAASVWGDPAIGKFMTDVGSTGTSFEVRSDVLNHLPLLIDDLSKIKESYKDGFTDLVYAWCSGKGKDRSDQSLGLRRSCTWKNITITCYEHPLATEAMRGGAVNRILDFRTEPGDIFTKEEGNATVSVITRNYGFAGKMFVELVKAIGVHKIKEIQQAYLKKIDTYCASCGDEKEDKQKLPLSILLAADELTSEYIFRDGVRLDFEWCVSQLKSKEDVSENQRAYDSIMDDVMIHTSNFCPDARGEYRGEIWGGFKDRYVYINPTVFNSMADRYGFSLKAFVLWAEENGLLLHDKGKHQKTARIPKDANSMKYYALKVRGEEDPGNTDKKMSDNSDRNKEFMRVDEQMEIPFD